LLLRQVGVEASSPAGLIDKSKFFAWLAQLDHLAPHLRFN
jgi:hypothetical protein